MGGATLHSWRSIYDRADPALPKIPHDPDRSGPTEAESRPWNVNSVQRSTFAHYSSAWTNAPVIFTRHASCFLLSPWWEFWFRTPVASLLCEISTQAPGSRLACILLKMSMARSQQIVKSVIKKWKKCDKLLCEVSLAGRKQKLWWQQQRLLTIKFTFACKLEEPIVDSLKSYWILIMRYYWCLILAFLLVINIPKLLISNTDINNNNLHRYRIVVKSSMHNDDNNATNSRISK